MTNLFTKYADAFSHKRMQNQIRKFNPPWMELGEFLWSANTGELAQLSKKAPEYGDDFWVERHNSYNCLNYALNKKDVKQQQIENLSLCQHWQETLSDQNVTATTELYLNFFKAVNKKWWEKRIGHHILEEKVLTREMPALLKHGLQVVESPDDVGSDQYLIAFTRLYSGTFHFVRLDKDGRWSEKPSKYSMPRLAENNEPLTLSQFSLPVCFFAVPT
ncbi:MAG: hypothetical protein JKY11_04315 [Alphaproteobacteria bacterium]|nr:hypothetical protein [Alphaproteobacteria bacterium]